jgi:hypothetical protein
VSLQAVQNSLVKALRQKVSLKVPQVLKDSRSQLHQKASQNLLVAP